MTSPNIGTVERAFQLAQSGECQNIAEIRYRLVQEHYTDIDAHLGGNVIKKQLVELIAVSWGKKSPYLGRPGESLK